MIGFAKFGPTAPFEFLGSLEKNLCLLEKHLCFLEKHLNLPEKYQVKKTFVYAGLVSFCSHPYNSEFVLQRMVVFFALDFMFLNFLDCVLGIQVECNSVDSSELVFDLDDFHLNKKDSYGS